VKIRSLSGTDVDLPEDALSKLGAALRGSLHLPGEPAWEESRTVWNAMIDRRPALVARPIGIADVVQCVNFARERSLLMAIKGGGHNIAGLGTCEGGFLVDLSRMRGVWVDPATRLARAQAGCLLGDVDRETQLHGLAAVLGFVSATGVAGLTLGGGFGYLSRRHGWTSDQVAAIDMVLADGSRVRASENENADLFWGLRGGGGNFGIATGFEYRLFPVGPEITGGAIAWPLDQAREVLDLFRELTEHGPDDLACAVTLRPAPPAPWLPVEMHGKPVVALVVCHFGGSEEGLQAIARIKGFGKPVGDVVTRRPYAQQQALLDPTQPKGRRYYWKSEYLPKLEPAILDLAIEHAKRIVSPHSAFILFPIGGTIHRLPADHSAVGNRDASVVVNIAASWEAPGDDAREVEWARAAWREARKFSTGGTYVNFLTEEETGDRIQAAYGANLERLREIKHRWDPDNLFRTNKNIAPL
jgi:FAD/FMN-containing dehydrogenase